MKRNSLILSLFLLSCIGCGQKDTTEFPENGYKLKVNGKSLEVFDCRVSAIPFNKLYEGVQRPIEQTEIAGFAYWDTEKYKTPMKIEIISQREVENVVIRPASYGIKHKIKGNRITFVIDKPCNIAVEVNDYHHALHLFANKPETDVPLVNTPGVHYYGPGVHDVGQVELKSNESVYVAPGAIVYGRFRAVDAENVRIYGRGIIDGSKLERGTGNLAGFMGCRNVTVESVILVDPSSWCCALYGCKGATISDIKLVGLWRYNADGIDLSNCSDVVVKDCFVRSFDDALVVKGLKVRPGRENWNRPVENIVFSNCVLWCDWNVAIEIGAETSAPVIKNVSYRNIDVIRATDVVLDIQHGDCAEISDIVFENIRVEIDDITPRPQLQMYGVLVYDDTPDPTHCPSLMDIRIGKTMWAQDDQLGSVRNITFKDISVTSNRMPPSAFKGANEESQVWDVTVENLRLNGKHIASAEEAGLKIGDFVNNVQFK